MLKKNDIISGDYQKAFEKICIFASFGKRNSFSREYFYFEVISAIRLIVLNANFHADITKEKYLTEQ